MRIFVQLDDSNLIIAELYTDGIPGRGPTMPVNFIEVTDRDDGPWILKTYDRDSDTFIDTPGEA